MPTVATAAIMWAEQAPLTPSTVDLWFFGPTATDVFAAWGQWAGGFGSILAVLVALWLAGRDSRHAKKAEMALRAARARTVIATVEQVPFPDPDPVAVHPRTARGFTVVNHGQTPVLEVSVLWIFIPSTGQQVGRDPGRVAEVLGPGDHVFEEHAGVDESWAQGPVCTFEFLDTDGYRWRRVGNSAPRLVTRAQKDWMPLWTRREKMRFALTSRKIRRGDPRPRGGGDENGDI